MHLVHIRNEPDFESDRHNTTGDERYKIENPKYENTYFLQEEPACISPNILLKDPIRK